MHFKFLSFMTWFSFGFLSLHAIPTDLPEKFVEIMQKPLYKNSTWYLYAKDPVTNTVYFDLNSDKFFLPASTTKLFSVAALLNAYGDDYRFKTPIYAFGNIENGVLDGHLVLVAQGDLTFGGRQANADTIEYTKMDHIIANIAPDAILTKGDPLAGIKNLSHQIKESGIKEISGDVLIDDRIFETVEKRGMILSPMMINENLIDLIINPGVVGTAAKLEVRPMVRGYTVKNELKTTAKGTLPQVEITSDDFGANILLTGTVPEDVKDYIRTFSIKDPKNFAKNALIQALEAEGIKVNAIGKTSILPDVKAYQNLKPIAVWTSAPLSEYAKLILKVSHNYGADLIPFLLALKTNKKTFEEGMRLLGKFIIDEVKISKDNFSFLDAAGGNDNRVTPLAEITLLEYLRKQPKEKFKKFYDALPILGVDGSLEDFGKKTNAVNKARAKPGTGATANAATGDFFLTTQVYSGYVEGRNGHLIEFVLGINNAPLTKVEDVIPIFEELGEMMGVIYELAK